MMNNQSGIDKLAEQLTLGFMKSILSSNKTFK